MEAIGKILAIRTAICCLIATVITMFGQPCSIVLKHFIQGTKEPFNIGLLSSTLFAMCLSPQLIECKREVVFFWDFILTGYTFVSFIYSYLFCYIRSIYDESTRASQFENALKIQQFSTQQHLIKECCICFEDYQQKEQIAVMPCFHYFHESCAKKWIAHKQNCPLCR